jgi:hypothetical protein
MFINLTIQILWILYASITSPAAKFYGVSDLYIGLLAMSFMIAFIPLSVPVAWGIDTYGFRPAGSIGAALMGVFGLLAWGSFTVLPPGSRILSARAALRPPMPAHWGR